MYCPGSCTQMTSSQQTLGMKLSQSKPSTRKVVPCLLPQRGRLKWTQVSFTDLQGYSESKSIRCCEGKVDVSKKRIVSLNRLSLHTQLFSKSAHLQKALYVPRIDKGLQSWRNEGYQLVQQKLFFEKVVQMVANHLLTAPENKNRNQKVYLEDTNYEYRGNADTLLMNGVETSKGSSNTVRKHEQF